MKPLRFLTLLCAVFLAVLSPKPAQAASEVSFDFFYDSLAPYGEWAEVGKYGLCWRPTGVDEDWSPYADGYWSYTDAGWTWVSYEDYGGIVYHYGRWIRTDDEGWYWKPDYEWAPAWVSWRQSDDYVGWAPLPPEADWQPSVGFSTWVDQSYDIGPGYYNFCRVRDFGAPVLRPVICRRSDNVVIIRGTRNITNITYNSYGDYPVIYNGGLDYALINRRLDRPIPALKLVRRADFNDNDWRDRNDRGGRGDQWRRFNPQAQGNQLLVVAPVVRPPVNFDAFKSRTKRVVSEDRVSRGWGIVKNDEVRNELRREIQQQSKGLNPETARARPVRQDELKFVPQKGNPEAPSPVAVRRGDRPQGNESEADRNNRERGPAGNLSEEERKRGNANGTLKPFNNPDGSPAQNPQGRPAVGTEDQRNRNPQNPEGAVTQGEGKMRDRGNRPDVGEEDRRQQQQPPQAGEAQRQQQQQQRAGEAQRQQAQTEQDQKTRQQAEALQKQQAEQQQQKRSTEERNRPQPAQPQQDGEGARRMRQQQEQQQQQQQKTDQQEKARQDDNRRGEEDKARRQQNDAAQQMRQQQQQQAERQRNSEAQQRQQAEPQRNNNNNNEQQRRQPPQQQQQQQPRGDGEGARRQDQAAEQNRRSQEAQRQQQQGESRRQEQQRQAQPQQQQPPQRQAQPQQQPQNRGNGERGGDDKKKDKDKDKDKGN